MIKVIIFDFNGVIYTDDYDTRLLDFIRRLRKDYKIGMISNYSPAGYKKYIEPIKGYFDDIVISSHVGLAKPQPEIYHLAAKRLEAQPSECVYIDDEDYRVEGAKRAGLEGIVYKDLDQMKSELNKILSSVADN